MNDIPLFLWIPLWALLATLGHELTHYVFWLPIATDIDWDVWGNELEIEHISTPWAMRWAIVASMAPLIVGIIAITAWWSTSPQPLSDAHEGIMAIGLAVYTFAGGKADYSRLTAAVTTRLA